MDVNDIESSPGKPNYSALIIMPTQCFKNYWGNVTTTALVINGIHMQRQSLSPILEWFMFSGDLKYRWSSDCNTILIGGSGTTVPDALSVYEKMLGTFQFTHG